MLPLGIGWGPASRAGAGCGQQAGSTGAEPASTAHPWPQAGGDKTGPNPTDRGKLGTRRRLITDRGGIPPAFMLTTPKTHDSMPSEELPGSIPPIGGKAGQPRRRPDKPHADKVNDHQRCRRRTISARIARRGIETSQKPGRHRWVIKRAFAWINHNRRLVARYERRSDIHHALTTLACSLIYLNKL